MIGHSRNPFVFAALLSICTLTGDASVAAEPAPAAGYPATAQATDNGQKGFTAAEQKTLMNFILQYDMGKAVEPGVMALLRAHDDACAITLVMDTYGVPHETAALFVRLAGQSNGIAGVSNGR